jgi:hypothetical protein
MFAVRLDLLHVLPYEQAFRMRILMLKKRPRDSLQQTILIGPDHDFRHAGSQSKPKGFETCEPICPNGFALLAACRLLSF